MSERIVDNPANHGWVEENGKWVWQGMDDIAGIIISDTEPTDKVEGMQWLDNTTGKVWIWDGSAWFQFPQGKDGAPGKDGNIADATEQGVIATWDNTAGQWTPDSSMVIDAGGNVGIGTSSPASKLHTDVASGNNEFRQSIAGVAAGQLITSTTDQYLVNLGSGAQTFYNNGSERMRIDSSGNVQVTGTLGNATLEGNGAVLEFSRDGANYIGARGGSSSLLIFQTGGATERMRIDADGKVGINTAGSTAAPSSLLHMQSESGSNSELIIQTKSTSDDSVIKFGDNGALDPGSIVYKHSNDSMEFGTARSTRMTIDANGRVDINGSLYVNGTPKIGTGELIETLATLRASTLDETVDVRQALASACDKLIEKFESMQEVATQEVEDDS